jgi:uncharacterized protein (DUF433 family)
MEHHDRIASDPTVRFGKATVRGRRITVFDVSYLTSGITCADIIAAYPPLTRADVVACVAFAADREHG